MYFAFLVFVLVAVFGVFIFAAVSEEGKGMIVGLGLAICAALFFVVTAFASFHNIPAGHEGLVYTFGKITGRRSAGLVTIAPWASVKIVNVQTQTIRPTTDCSNGSKQCMDAFSKETQDVYITPALNIHIDPTQIENLYTKVGPDYVNKLILPKEIQSIKEETVKYSAIDVAPNRNQITTDVQSNLQSLLAPSGIVVEYLSFENVDFSTAFKKSIEDKQVATQNALKEQAQVDVATQQAKQVAAKAQGDADALRINAQGQADANNLINSSLTPNLIQFQAVQKLAGNVQIALVPSGQGVIIDPTTLLKSAPAK